VLPGFRIGTTLLVAMLLASLAAVCAAPEGIIHSSSGTTVDGTPALEGMHIFGGQMLRTGPGRFSETLTHGSSLRLFGDTKLEFNDNSAELISGGVLLSTASRFSVQSGCANITPQDSTARYTVQMEGKTVYVAAQQNGLTVKSRKSVRVEAGKTVAVYCGAAAQNIVFLGGDLASKVIMGSAVAASPLATLPQSGSGSGSKPEMSSSSPSH